MPGVARKCEMPDRQEEMAPLEYQVRVLVGKQAHGETRVAALDVEATRDDVYPALANLLADRL